MWIYVNRRARKAHRFPQNQRRSLCGRAQQSDATRIEIELSEIKWSTHCTPCSLKVGDTGPDEDLEVKKLRDLVAEYVVADASWQAERIRMQRATKRDHAWLQAAINALEGYDPQKARQLVGQIEFEARMGNGD